MSKNSNKKVAMSFIIMITMVIIVKGNYKLEGPIKPNICPIYIDRAL